jgi:hypothetical protein
MLGKEKFAELKNAVKAILWRRFFVLPPKWARPKPFVYLYYYV